MGIDRLVKYSMLSLAILSSSCTTGRNIKGGDIVSSESRVEVNPVKGNSKLDNQNYRNLDEIISDLENSKIEWDYKEKQNRIINTLKKHDYDSAHSLIKTYAREYEKKGDRENLLKLKEFSYMRYDYVSEKVETKEKTNVLKGAGMVSLVIVSTPLIILNNILSNDKIDIDAEEIREMSKSSKTKIVEEAHYRKVSVNPYYGTEKVIDEHVPVYKVK